MTGVVVAGLGYRYPGGDRVLTDVDLSLQAGERLAVLGANGAGKSTLLLHLNGLLLPETGTVTIGNVVVMRDTLREVRRRVGFVFQHPDDQLFLPTLLEDVAFGPLNDGASADDAAHAARAILTAFGLEHASGRAAHHLSGGEKRLASLATVLVMEPEVLVLDEPTAGLDGRSRRRVVDRLTGRSETLVVATHDLEVAAALCTQAVVLAGGRVAAVGSIQSVLGDPGLLSAHGLVDPLHGTLREGIR